jgi:hypothetical protein
MQPLWSSPTLWVCSDIISSTGATAASLRQSVGQVLRLLKDTHVSPEPLHISSETYIGKVVIDSHDFSSVECSWRDEVDPVKPAVLGRICLHATGPTISANIPTWSKISTLTPRRSDTGGQ